MKYRTQPNQSLLLVRWAPRKQAASTLSGGQNAVEDNTDSPSDYREASECSKRMFDDTCAGLGLSPSDPACGAYIRNEGIQIIQGVALVFIPAEPYEFITN